MSQTADKPLIRLAVVLTVVVIGVVVGVVALALRSGRPPSRAGDFLFASNRQEVYTPYHSSRPV